MSSSLHQEYEEGVDALGAGMVFYKFFSLLTVKTVGEETTVRFGRGIVDEDVSRDVATRLKDYVKEQKEWVRENGRDVSLKECQRRMWWLVEKILEFGVFTSAEQKHIMIWLDICLDRLTSP